MKQTRFLLSCLFFFWAGIAMAQSPAEKICGVWISEDGNSHIKIYESGGKFHGKIVWLKEPNDGYGKPKTDVNNPSSRLQDRPLKGLVIISDLKYKKGSWQDGEMYIPKKGKILDCDLELLSERKLALSLSKSFYSKTTTMTRL